MKKIICKSTGGNFNPMPGNPMNAGTSPMNVPKYVEWIPRDSNQEPDFLFYIDNGLQMGLSNNDLKYGMILEAKSYIRHNLDHIINNMELYRHHYKYIFTYYDDLANLGPPFAYATCAGLPRTRIENRKIFPKTKLVSMLVSVTNSLPGHKDRLAYMEKYAHCMDVFGTGRPTQVANVEDAFMDYMFSVGMENQIEDAYFTDKITHQFVNGTVPIYRGSKVAVNRYFDPDGVLWTDEINIETDLSEDLYHSMMPHIINNYNITMNNIPNFEDYIAENYLMKSGE